MTLRLSDSHRRVIEEARRVIIINANRCIESALLLFENSYYSQSTFLAMTAIEECGKLYLLERVQREGSVQPRRLNAYLRNHFGKAIIAAINAFMVNSGADRRQGSEVTYGVARIGITKGKWMETRSLSLYGDINVAQNYVIDPQSTTGLDHAYYFIVVALEIIAELSGMGFNAYLDPKKPTYDEGVKFWRDTLLILENFMSKWKDKFDTENLNFIHDPKGFTGTNRTHYGDELSEKFGCIIADILGRLGPEDDCDDIYVGGEG